MSLINSDNWSEIPGGITAANGFKASGISAGLKPSGKLDLALLLAPPNSICAGVFTQSTVRAECVNLSLKRILKNQGKNRAVLINSGHANACTGGNGLKDTLLATRLISDKLLLKESDILMCSTGVIGEKIPMDKLTLHTHKLVQNLDKTGGLNAARAILTTDLIKKEIALESFFGGEHIRIGAMAKGSGMIHPDMATMLMFLTCDVLVPYPDWSVMIKKAADLSFNSISVDGDTSTNDSFLAFSSGSLLQKDLYDHLQLGLIKASQFLAKRIVGDGEGANCVIEVIVKGTKNSIEARKIAKTICSSSLVKTAIHGGDPNWGRIIAAAGRSGVSFDLNQLDLKIGIFQLIKAGQPVLFDRKKVSEYIKSKLSNSAQKEIIHIYLSIGNQNGEGIAWGCDLSENYIKINADYTT